MYKLHLGCGKRYMPGYIHVDLNDFPHIDFKHSVFNLPMFDDNSVDEIYFSHGIEYVDRVQIIEVLKEYKRVLKPGGILRLAVPDFEALSNLYQETKDLSLVIGPLYGRWPISDGSCFYHKTVYDFNSLLKVLLDAGFQNVKRWDWREIFKDELEGFDDFSRAYQPHLDFENGKLMSLNVQCEKK